MEPFATAITFASKTVYRPEELLTQLDELESRGVITGIERSRFLGKCNSFITASGFEPGRGFFLMKGKDVNDLQTSINNTTHTAVFQGPNTVQINKLIITHCEGLTTGLGSIDDALYVVHVADLRILGPMTSINKAYNVRPPDPSTTYYAYSKNGGSNWTFNTLVPNIWTNMPSAFGSLSVSRANFTGRPENYVFHGVSAWDALKKILDDTNHILTLSYTGQFAVEAAFTDNDDFNQADFDAQEYTLVNSRAQISAAHQVPEKIRVFFPSRNRAFHLSTDVEVVDPNAYSHEAPLYSVDKSTGVTGAVAGTVLPVYHPLAAEYDKLGTITNSATLDTHAEQIKNNYKDAIQKSDKPSFYRYSGAHPIKPGVEIRSVCFHDTGKGLMTDARGYPRSKNPSPLLGPNGSPYEGDSQSLSSRENNGPPNFTRLGERPGRVIKGKLSGSLSPGGQANAIIWYFDGTNMVASTKTITVTDWFLATGETIATGVKIIVWYDELDDRYYVLGAACD